MPQVCSKLARTLFQIFVQSVRPHPAHFTRRLLEGSKKFQAHYAIVRVLKIMRRLSKDETIAVLHSCFA